MKFPDEEAANVKRTIERLYDEKDALRSQNQALQEEIDLRTDAATGDPELVVGGERGTNIGGLARADDGARLLLVTGDGAVCGHAFERPEFRVSQLECDHLDLLTTSMTSAGPSRTGHTENMCPFTRFSMTAPQQAMSEESGER